MIVKFFKRGKGCGSAPINYLLGKKRDRKDATLLRGNPDETQEIINASLYAKKYTSGVLSFEEKNIPEELKNEIMDSFEECLFAGLDRNQYNCLWVQHLDKGRLELNFVIPNIELLSGKRLQPYFHAADHKRVDAWRTIQNITYGFSDPDDPQKRQILTISNNLPKSIQDIQERITDGLMNLAMQGEIKDRSDVLNILKNSGFEIARTTPTSISLKNPLSGGRNIRLKGTLYEETFRFSQDLSAEISARSEKHRAAIRERYSRAEQIYQSGIEAKRAENYRRHSSKTLTYQKGNFPILPLDLGLIDNGNIGAFGSECVPNERSSKPMEEISNNTNGYSQTGKQIEQIQIENLQLQQSDLRLHSDLSRFTSDVGQQQRRIQNNYAEREKLGKSIGYEDEQYRNYFTECARRFRKQSQSDRAGNFERIGTLKGQFDEISREIGNIGTREPRISGANSRIKHNTERNFNELERANRELSKFSEQTRNNFDRINQVIRKITNLLFNKKKARQPNLSFLDFLDSMYR